MFYDARTDDDVIYERDGVALLGAMPWGQRDFRGATLGDIRSDLARLLSLIPGGTTKLAQLEAYIRSEAEAGAKQAIPEIRRQVQVTATPYVYAALALGFGGFLLGLGALIIARRRAG